MKGISIGFKSTKYALLTLALFWAMGLLSCSDEVLNKNVVPSISLDKIEQIKDVAGKDSLLVLGISYVDADGDIGLDGNDTFPPYHRGSEFQYNYFIDIREVKGGSLLPITRPGTGELENFNQRIPNLTPTGRNKHISGEINIRLDATLNYLYPDSLVCTLQIADRSLNKSNIIETGLIVLRH